MTPTEFVRQVRAALEPHRDPSQAEPMARYMKHRFPFLGLKRPQLEPLVKPLLARSKGHDEAWLHAAALGLWELPEREFQYAAVAVLHANRKTLSGRSLELAEALLQAKPWWDSVDALTSSVVGPLVLRLPELGSEMDRWSRHPDFWVRRSAILHQLGYKGQTDPERLFRYCLENAPDKEFFIRKAIGWALRQYAYTDPKAVHAFVEVHRARLSPLSLREALKHQKGGK